MALIRDWRKLLPAEVVSEAADDKDWKADLAPEQAQFWEQEWQAVPAPRPAPTTPKTHSGDYHGERDGRR